MTVMAMNVAIRSAMDVMMERDHNVVVFGQDVGYFGGVFRCTEGLQTKYGSSAFSSADRRRWHRRRGRRHGRLRPATGGRDPVRRLRVPGLDQLISEAARLRYRSVPSSPRR